MKKDGAFAALEAAIVLIEFVVVAFQICRRIGAENMGVHSSL